MVGDFSVHIDNLSNCLAMKYDQIFAGVGLVRTWMGDLQGKTMLMLGEVLVDSVFPSFSIIIQVGATTLLVAEVSSPPSLKLFGYHDDVLSKSNPLLLFMCQVLCMAMITQDFIFTLA